jgi:hypothetical protein
VSPSSCPWPVTWWQRVTPSPALKPLPVPAELVWGSVLPGLAPAALLSWRAALPPGPLWVSLNAVLQHDLSLCCSGVQLQYYDLGVFCWN